MYLFDSTIWIDFLKNVQSPEVELLIESLPNYQIATCPTLFQEILQGIKEEKQYKKIYSVLTIATQQLPDESYQAAIGAATIYRNLRANGATIRKPNDCLIAWYSMSFNCPLVHNNKDFNLIAKYFPLNCWSEENS